MNVFKIVDFNAVHIDVITSESVKRLTEKHQIAWEVHYYEECSFTNVFVTTMTSLDANE